MYQREGNTSAWQEDEREKVLAPHGRGAQNRTEVSRYAARWERGAIEIAGHIETQGRGELDHQGKEDLGADSHRVQSGWT